MKHDEPLRPDTDLIGYLANKYRETDKDRSADDYVAWEQYMRDTFKVRDLYAARAVASLYPSEMNVTSVSDPSSAEDICPACGSADLVPEGNAYTQHGTYQRYRCEACGMWSRGNKRLN